MIDIIKLSSVSAPPCPHLRLSPSSQHPRNTPRRVRKARKEDRNPKSCDEVFAALAADVGPEELYNEVIHQVGDAGDAVVCGGRVVVWRVSWQAR